MFFLNKSINLNKKNAEAYYYRGITREYLEHKDKLIIKDYSKAIKLNAKPEYYFNRANYNSFSEPQKAINDYNKVIELLPNDYRAYVGRATTTASRFYNPKETDKQLVENDFEKALQLECDSASVLLSRGITRIYNIKDYPGAISDLTFVIMNYPNNLRAYYERASAYYFNKELEMSCNDFKTWKSKGGGGWVWYIKESCGIDYDTWMKKE
jgi:tetratricopeptide (TPR) repeat protein